MSFGAFSIEDLVEEFQKAVALERKKQDENCYMTTKQVEQMLHVNRTTLWRWEKDKYLCPVRIGRRVLYRRESVIAKIQDREERV